MNAPPPHDAGSDVVDCVEVVAPHVEIEWSLPLEVADEDAITVDAVAIVTDGQTTWTFSTETRDDVASIRFVVPDDFPDVQPPPETVTLAGRREEGTYESLPWISVRDLDGQLLFVGGASYASPFVPLPGELFQIEGAVPDEAKCRSGTQVRTLALTRALLDPPVVLEPGQIETGSFANRSYIVASGEAYFFREDDPAGGCNDCNFTPSGNLVRAFAVAR